MSQPTLELAGEWRFPSWRPDRHISAGLLQRACQDGWRQAGLTKRITPHSLRHAFASYWLDNGVDTRVIQVLLGHSRIDTTARYTAVSPGKIAATSSPLDQLLARHLSTIWPRLPAGALLASAPAPPDAGH
jgi:site-specific recombinase XerD